MRARAVGSDAPAGQMPVQPRAPAQHAEHALGYRLAVARADMPAGAEEAAQHRVRRAAGLLDFLQRLNGRADARRRRHGRRFLR